MSWTRITTSLKRQVQHKAQELALLEGRQHVPRPSAPAVTRVCRSLNFDFAAMEARVADHDTALRTLQQ